MKIIVLFIICFLSWNVINAQYIGTLDLNEYIEKSNLEKVRFNLSMPVLDNSADTSINWPVKYVVFIEDTMLQAFCNRGSNDKAILMDLIKMLEDKKFDWVANLCLYSITGLNAIELSSY